MFHILLQKVFFYRPPTHLLRVDLVMNIIKFSENLFTSNIRNEVSIRERCNSACPNLTEIIPKCALSGLPGEFGFLEELHHFINI